MNEITISVPSAPIPEFATILAQNRGERWADDTRPVLSVLVVDTDDGYGIVGEDMVPGRSVTIRIDPERQYEARLRYIREDDQSIYPLLVYVHPYNTEQVHVAWERADGSEAGGNVGVGKTLDLRDVWTKKHWIIEAKK